MRFIAGRLSVVAWWCSIAGKLRLVNWRLCSVVRKLRLVAWRWCSVAGLVEGSCVARNRAIIWLLWLVRCWLLRIRLVRRWLLRISWFLVGGLLRVRWRKLFRIHRCPGGRLLRVGWRCFRVGRLSRGCIGFIRWWCVWWRSWMTVRVGRWRTIWRGRRGSIWADRTETCHHVVLLGDLKLVLGDPVLHTIHGLGVGEAKWRAVDLVEELGGIDEVESIHQTAK